MTTSIETASIQTGRTIRFAGIGDEAGADPRAQLAALARLGWSMIELRTVHGCPIAELDDRRFADLAGTLRAGGIRVVSVASRIGSWARPITGLFELDLHELDVLAHRCMALGTRWLRIMSYPNDGLSEPEWRRRCIDRIRILVQRAEQAGLVLLHENCSGWAGTDAGRMLRLIEEVNSPALRLLFDTGNGVAHGYQAYDLLTEIAPHVVHVHVKDADGDRADPVYVLPGAGRARVADCLRLLLRSGYSGVWSIEPHLALRPHQQPAGTGGVEAPFVAAGRALERLV
ncbi:MAG TPA: TIM barrel protein, partial [Pseudonocardiaceae bacterium]|nr:TIM barrel protein [Pseudonocardiaceae bacterium]